MVAWELGEEVSWSTKFALRMGVVGLLLVVVVRFESECVGKLPFSLLVFEFIFIFVFGGGVS